MQELSEMKDEATIDLLQAGARKARILFLPLLCKPELCNMACCSNAGCLSLLLVKKLSLFFHEMVWRKFKLS
jgi:hypothetical protein